MAMSLDEFTAEALENLKQFAEDYRNKHEENPEHYPLVLENGQEGLWYEFLLDFAGPAE